MVQVRRCVEKNRSQRGAAGARALALLAMLAGVAAIAILVRQAGDIGRLRSEAESLRVSVETAQARADAALAAVVAPETLAAAPRSVYLVVVDGQAKGTAFVLDRDRGILVTAAHVADPLLAEDGTGKAAILNRFAKAPIPIESRRLHAGYGAFRTLVEDYQPIRANSSIYAPLAAPLRDLAFDAALITVDPIDPETGENRLGPNLQIAGEQTLLNLAPGAPIAVIGYPYDTLDDGFAPDAAIARVERGVIAAMTPPLDNAAEAYDPVVANLIIHRLSTAGGNSGSPIVNAAGEVIGIHTHGVVSSSSNGDGAAQRAEVIADLMAPEREARRLDEIFRPAWRRMLSHWARAEDALPWSFYMEHGEPGLAPAPLVSEILAGPLRFDRGVERLEFEPAADSRRVEAADLPAENGEPRSFTIKARGQYAEFWRTIDRRRDHVLFAFDYSLRSRTGFCPLAAYWRKAGDAQLKTMPMRASFEFYLPADDAAGIEDYQIVLRRAENCDPISAEFFAGSASWPLSDSSEALQASFGATAKIRRPHAPQPAAKDPSRLERARAFAECRILRRNNSPRCRADVVIELDPPQ